MLVGEALPKGLEDLLLHDSPKLIDIPSLATMKSLVHLNLRNCHSLKHVDGLECLIGLEYIDISSCTSMGGCGIHVI